MLLFHKISNRDCSNNNNINLIDMKKTISLLFLLLVGVGVYAQKSYITLGYSDGSAFGQGCKSFLLTGDVSEDLADYLGFVLSPSSYGTKHWYTQQYETLGDILNKFSAKGYEIEYALDVSHFILSKKTEGSSSAVQRVRDDNDSEPREVARYNLQGVPVKKYEKGIQIIVFSNYTTKTVIVE